MDAFDGVEIGADQACLWFLGQAGYVVASCGKRIAIDPYLSDSAGKHTPELTRLVPVPVAPADLEVDLFIVTHDHDDHLDPETISGYAHKDETVFVAPRFASRTLSKLGVPEEMIVKVDVGETRVVDSVEITGVYAVPSEPGAIDTAGYLVRFPNGRSLYHTSDTGYSDLLCKAAPHAEVLLVCINGKWGNLNVAEAVTLAGAVNPTFAIPNHYDMMAVNSENPETFRFEMKRSFADIDVRVLEVLRPFIW